MSVQADDEILLPRLAASQTGLRRPSIVGNPPMLLIRSDSNVQGIGAALIEKLKNQERVSLRAMGAAAVNQAMKGIVNARQRVAAFGEDLVLRPGMVTVSDLDGSGDDGVCMVLHCSLDHAPTTLGSWTPEE